MINDRENKTESLNVSDTKLLLVAKAINFVNEHFVFEVGIDLGSHRIEP
jgi:hypothetical protein